MSNKIIAHVVGLSQSMKDKFILFYEKHYKNKNINLVDLDRITIEIINDNSIIKLYDKLDKMLLGKKKMNKEMKEIEVKINDFWKAKIDNFLIKELAKGKNIICIGLSTYFKNHKVGIKLLTSLKLFFKIDLKENAQAIIKDNIKKYESDILDGNFNLEFLDLHILMKKRELLQNTYEKMGYQSRSFKDIINIIRIGVSNYIPNNLFFIFENKLSKTEINKRKIVAYTFEWLAIASIFKNNIDKGYKTVNKKKIPFIKILKQNIIEKYNTPIYIYMTEDVESFMPEITNSGEIYKYISTKPIKKFDMLYIENPIQKLKSANINIITI